jgi:hypothetical protein
MTDRYQELLEAARVYHPSKTGIHVCGFDALDSPITVLNFALEESIAIKKFEAIKEEFDSGDDGDLILDLCVENDLVDNFWIRRQSLDAIRRLIDGQAVKDQTND